jgi:hypothetical protein
MKKLAALTLSLFLTTGIALADSTKDANSQPAKAPRAAKARAATKPEKAEAAIAAQLEELRQALQSQQEQLQLLKEELAKRDRQIDEAREAAAAANARASEASTKAAEAVNTSAEVKTTAVSLNSTVGDLKASNEILKTTVAKEQAEAKKAEETGPTTIKYKGINITPGGFIAAETVFRNRATSGDINTPFTGIPYPANALSKVTENNFTARQTRATLLAETTIGSAKVSGYYEGDFLGAGTTSNNRQSNSYVFRQRQVWGNVTWASGFTIAAGQMWSLVTETKKGIANRQEAFPLQIDPQYVVGWAWQRAYAFRVVQNWDKFGFGLSIEGPQTTIGGRGFPANFFINAPGAGGGLYNTFDSAGYSINRAPDFLVKFTLDPGWGHYEVVGILSNFRNRIYPCGVPTAVTPLPAACNGSATSTAGAFNDSRVGGGVGATARFPIGGKKADLAVHFQGGDGIGRYSSAQLADVTARPDGTLAPIRSAAWLGTLELHPSPKFDFYAYGGGEYAARTAFTYVNAAGANVAVGYGNPLFNNSGCSTELFPTGNGAQPPGTPNPPSGSGFPNGGGACAGDIRHILEGTIGFWHKPYSGPKGRVQWGVQYSYLTKYGWSGSNNNQAAGTPPVLLPAVIPHAVDNMVLTSFRYYLP